MRPLFTILALICFLALLGRQAQAQNSSYKVALTFFSEKGERFWVVINGIRQNEQANQNVKVPNLTGNAWKAQIVFENQNLPEVGKSIYIPVAPTQEAELVYQIKRNRKGVYQVRLFSSTGFPNQMIEIIRGEGGKFTFPKIPFPSIPQNPPTESPTPNRPAHRYPNRYPPLPPSPTPSPSQYPCNLVMNEQIFDSLKDNIQAQQFEETKENTAKQAITHYCLSSVQAKKILRLFSFEQTKLDFAKWVYDYVYDKENFYQVNDVFDFGMSVDELQDYVKNKR